MVQLKEIASSSRLEASPKQPADISLSQLRKQINGFSDKKLKGKILPSREELIEDIFELQHPRNRDEENFGDFIGVSRN